MGIFYPYIPFENTKLIGVEAAGEGLDTGKHAASLQKGSSGVLHGNRTFIMQDDNGQILDTHSISAGLDYPGVGPEHAWLQEIGVQNLAVVVLHDEGAVAVPKALFLRWNPAMPLPTP